MTTQKLFESLDLSAIAADSDFKEDSVREIIILPILKKLGYTRENIIRSKNLQHPVLRTGSKSRPIRLVPDYVLKVGNNYAWVLDAKAPNEKIVNNDNVEQVYSYAFHSEIRSNYFALCNGLEFSLFRTSDPGSPILYFRLDEIEQHWQALKRYLSPTSFQSGKVIRYEKPRAVSVEQFDYATRPLLEEIPVKKQLVKRHFGCNAYFTRQTWNVVEAYVKNFSKPGDVVLDPFGGSGITMVEALMNDRKAVNVDLNPMAIFIVQSLTAPVKLDDLSSAFEWVKNEYLKQEPKTKDDVQNALNKYKGPQNLSLPKGSDVLTVHQLFTEKQRAQLALLKSIIKKQKDVNIRSVLLLAFYNTVGVINRTYHEMPRGGGVNFVMYYRYRIAPKPAKRNTIDVFESKFKRVLNGKKEMMYKIDTETISNAQIIKGSATDLHFLAKECIDYIYTDPPYGKKIPYLDLSTMWIAWLDLKVTEKDYELEAIEGGEHNKTKKEYNELIAQSIKEMYRVLKFDRWLSFVFAHKDPEFWHLIIDTAEACGFEYVGAVPQKNGHSSFKKAQHPFTVLSGQLIINFRKVHSPKTIMRANLGMNITEIVIQTIEGIIAKNDGATLEQINDELILKGLELGFLDLLKQKYSDISPILQNNFEYNKETEIYSLPKNTKFQSQIDIHLRIKFYLMSYLRRMDREQKDAHFNEIILQIMPLLKNGVTPERQTILSVLEDIAEQYGNDCWRLKKDGQKNLPKLNASF
jgi:16S rRNA G966 N2-methylase RsmD